MWEFIREIEETYKIFIDKKKHIEYCKCISLIQSGGVIRDYEATATPEIDFLVDQWKVPT